MTVVDKDIGPARAVDIPVGHSAVGLDVVKVVIDRTRPLGTDGSGHTSHPHILFVHRVGEPHVVARGSSLALGDATHVAGTKVLVLAHKASGRHLAMHHTHRVVGDAVVAADGDERITIGLSLYRVVADGITSVGCALTPLLAASHDERRDAHGSAPGLTVVGREGGIRPFPQRHGLAVLAVVVRGGLHTVDGVLEIVEPVESAVFVYPLQRLELVAEQRLASLAEALVLALGVEGIGGVGLIPLGVRRVTDEVDGTHRAFGLDFSRHTPYTSLLEGVVAVTVECHHE